MLTTYTHAPGTKRKTKRQRTKKKGNYIHVDSGCHCTNQNNHIKIRNPRQYISK